MTSKQIRTIFLLILTIILFILVFLIFKPFLSVILWAIFLSLIIKPLYNRIIKKFNKIKYYSIIQKILAAIFSILIIFIIVLPIFYFIYRITLEFKQFSIWIDSLIKNPNFISFDKFNSLIEQIIYKLTGINVNFNLIDELVKIIKSKSFEITPILTSTISKIINGIIGLFYLIITIYFILTDGDILIKYFKDILPIENKYIDEFSTKFSLVMNIIIKGYLIIGFYQSIIFFIILTVFKYPNPFLFSFLTFIASFIPMLGPTVIWLPISIIIGLTQSAAKGIIFAILSGFFVSTVDNFIRPKIISTKIKIHPLLLFFSIIGGIISFGYNGVLLGPLFLALLYSSLDIIRYQEEIVN
ncbi:MAG: AI-2E family transporter [Spirochaetota bacterium]